MRAVYSDLANRRHFTEEKQPIRDTRTLVTEWSAPAVADPAVIAAKTASNLQHAADSGFIEVG